MKIVIEDPYHKRTNGLIKPVGKDLSVLFQSEPHREAVSKVVARWSGGEDRILLSKFWKNSTTSSRWRGAVKRRKKYRVKQFQQRCLVEIAQAFLGSGSLTSKSGQPGEGAYHLQGGL